MWVLPLLGYVGLVLGFGFLTLAIASGLYYLSELVEEHSVLASRILYRLIYAVIAILALLLVVDGFPVWQTLLGVVSHCVYLTNLRHFPIVKLSDPWFVVSGVLVLVNHWVWFQHFSEPVGYGSPQYSYGKKPGGDRYSDAFTQPSFTEIASYFGICVWMVPFALFVSLSAGENVLPSMGSEYATGERPGVGVGVNGGAGFRKGHRRRNTGMAKAAVNNVKDWVGETGAVVGLWKRDNVRSFD